MSNQLKVLRLLFNPVKLSEILKGQRVRLLEDVPSLSTLCKGRCGTIQPYNLDCPLDLLVEWDSDGRSLLVYVEEVELADMGEGP